jgi:hypothetical protein
MAHVGLSYMLDAGGLVLRLSRCLQHWHGHCFVANREIAFNIIHY